MGNDQPRRLAILGASVRAAAESALEAGFDVVAADLFADADLADRCPALRVTEYPEAFVPWLAKQSVDTWIYTGALENHAQWVDRLAKIAPLWGVSGALLRQVRDPTWLAHACREQRIPFPPTVPVGLRDETTDGWLAKTYGNSSGVGVGSLDEIATRDHSLVAGAVLQEPIVGRSLSAVWTLNDKGPWLLGLTEQVVRGVMRSDLASATGAARWQYAGSLFVPDPDTRWGPTLASVGKWLHGLGLRGPVGIDWIDDGQQLWLIEINPRYTASVEVIERSTGQYALAGEQTIHSTLPQALPKSVWGKVVLYASRNVTAGPSFCRYLEGLHADRLVADLPRIGTRFSKGDPVTTLFAAAPSEGFSPEALTTALARSLVDAKRQLYGDAPSTDQRADSSGQSEQHFRFDPHGPPSGPHTQES